MKRRRAGLTIVLAAIPCVGGAWLRPDSVLGRAHRLRSAERAILQLRGRLVSHGPCLAGDKARIRRGLRLAVTSFFPSRSPVTESTGEPHERFYGPIHYTGVAGGERARGLFNGHGRTGQDPGRGQRRRPRDRDPAVYRRGSELPAGAAHPGKGFHRCAHLFSSRRTPDSCS